MSRSGSGRRDHRSDKGMAPHGSSSSNDGWISVGGASSQRNKDKVGDLTKFGSVTRSKITGNLNLTPGGILTGLSEEAKGWNSEKDGRNMYSVLTSESKGWNSEKDDKNMYSVLMSEDSEGRKSSETPSSEGQKSSPATERRKIILAPRTTTKSVSKSNFEAAPSVQSMSEELAKKKINGMTEEYFNIRDIQVCAIINRIIKKYFAVINIVMPFSGGLPVP